MGTELAARFLVFLWVVFCLSHPGLPATVSETVERAVVTLLNQARAKRKLAPYSEDAVLASAARTHSQNMARFNFFDHESPVRGQREVNDRVVAAGGRDGNFGENLYWCSGLAESRIGGSVIAEWLSSPDHRDTVLSSDYTHAGVGAFHRGKEYWVTLVCQE